MERFGICPLCLESGPLTRGHTVPKACGGPNWIGEGNSCNGHFKVADQSLRRFITYHDFLLTGGKAWVEFRAPGAEPVVGMLEASGREFRFFGDPSRNAPAKQHRFVERLNDLADRGSTDWSMQVTAEPCPTNHVYASLYHAAFLELCRFFPNDYPTDPCARYISEIILRPYDDGAPCLPEIVFQKSVPFRVEPPIAFIPDLHGFLVDFGAAITFMPGPGYPPAEAVKLWHRFKGSHDACLPVVIISGQASSEDESTGVVLEAAESGETYRLW